MNDTYWLAADAFGIYVYAPVIFRTCEAEQLFPKGVGFFRLLLILE